MNTIQSLGHQIVPPVYAAAEPSNQVAANAFEHIAGMITEGLSENGPFDGLHVDLHGAMVYEDFQSWRDPRSCRASMPHPAGEFPIVTSLDLDRDNITRESFDLASVMIGYRTYPHVDRCNSAWSAATHRGQPHRDVLLVRKKSI